MPWFLFLFLACPGKQEIPFKDHIYQAAKNYVGTEGTVRGCLITSEESHQICTCDVVINGQTKKLRCMTTGCIAAE